MAKGKIYVVKHVEDEGPGLIGEYFGRSDWDCIVLELCRGDALPQDLDEAAAAVILGGPMNVYEEQAYPFLAAENEFIRQVLREAIPFLGICLGAQLLAKACGSRVRKAKAKEIGWFEVQLTRQGREDPLYDGLGPGLTVFQWHEDTFSVPGEGILLATGSACRTQAIRVGNAYGLQFHVEVTPDMVEEWSQKERGAIDREEVLRKGKELNGTFRVQSERFCRNFEKIIKSRIENKERLLLPTNQP